MREDVTEVGQCRPEREGGREGFSECRHPISRTLSLPSLTGNKNAMPEDQR